LPLYAAGHEADPSAPVHIGKNLFYKCKTKQHKLLHQHCIMRLFSGLKQSQSAGKPMMHKLLTVHDKMTIQDFLQTFSKNSSNKKELTQKFLFVF
jgi:hypothetical protein